MKWETDSAPSEQELAAWTRRMIDYNRLQVDAYAYTNVIIKAVAADRSVIAGSHLQIGGGWLYIASLWVDENHRRRGIGRRLLRRAERIGIEKRCHGAYLYTYSFQSPLFYEKCGYRIFGKLERLFGEQTKYYMKKALPPSSNGGLSKKAAGPP